MASEDLPPEQPEVPDAGAVIVPDSAPPTPPIDWSALGLRNSDMERFADFVSKNLQLALDAAQGTNFTIMASLNTRLRELENKLGSPNLSDKERVRLEIRYRECAELALKAANQVTTSGYTRIKAEARAIDTVNKLKRKPGFVKIPQPAQPPK